MTMHATQQSSSAERLFWSNPMLGVQRREKGDIAVVSRRGKASAHFRVILLASLAKQSGLGLEINSSPEHATPGKQSTKTTSLFVPVNGGLDARTVWHEGHTNSSETLRTAVAGTALFGAYLALSPEEKAKFDALQAQPGATTSVKDAIGTDPMDAAIDLETMQSIDPRKTVLDVFPLARDLLLT